MSVHAYHGNNVKSKIAIITGDVDAERERIEHLKLNGSIIGGKCDEITWIPPIDITHQPDVPTIKKKLLASGCTNVIINLHKAHKVRVALMEMIIEDFHLQDNVRQTSSNFEIGALKDSYQPSHCYLRSSTKTSAEGWKEAFLAEVKEKKSSQQ